MTRTSRALLALAIVGVAATVRGQDADPLTVDGRTIPLDPEVITTSKAGVVVSATRINTPLHVDGILDEEFYGHVLPITGFTSRIRTRAPRSRSTPRRGCSTTTNTFTSVCRCWDEHPERIVANDMRRDSSNLRQNDNFAIELDTFHDKRNGFLFYVTPVGGMFDGLTTDERNNNGDWNTVWEAKARRFEHGWIAEIAIPFKSLRYKPGREQVWGIQLRRTIRAKNEYAYITPIRPQWGVGGIFRVSAAATLVGLEVPPAGKNLEIKPSTINRLTTDNLVDAAQHQRLSTPTSPSMRSTASRRA